MAVHPVNVVEPTLANEAGHCSMVVHSLCEAGAGLPFRLWVGRGASLPALKDLGLDIRPHFSRRLRKLQAICLYWRLLHEPGTIVVPTAGSFDLQVLHLVAPGRILPSKVFLYFHRLRLTPRKESLFKRLAAKQPNIVMLATTDVIESSLRNLGFSNTGVVLPFPVPAGAGDPTARAFRHVLVPGAARADKGIRQVVNLVAYLAEAASAIPVTIQVSGDHYDRHDEQTRQDLDRLRALQYPPLTLLPETLRSEAYGALFEGAICLQAYDPEEYAEAISGITLVALGAGAPIVAAAGTWMSRTVERFDAGLVVQDRSPSTLEHAIRAVIDRYSHYQKRARAAGEALRREQTWAPVVLRLRENGGDD